ncbi:YtxH domain-containing protein [Aliivibrio kagoshimensis]|uniref:YtxH domain-containing protein n=1 Tax=Aliivibrio kagoshimensis TaxID=2910230 RepID=UPI003D0BDB16
MFKYIILFVLAAGIYIGFSYQDKIADILDMRDMEEVQDNFEDLSDALVDGKKSITEKFNEITNN